MPVCICNHFYLLLFSKGDNDIGRIDMQHKVEACFGTQSVACVGSRCFLSKKVCGKGDDIVNDYNSLTIVGVVIIN